MASMVSDVDAPDPKSPLGVEVVMTQDGDRSSHRVVWYLHRRQDLTEDFTHRPVVQPKSESQIQKCQ
jgi:hypothetical protein